MIQTILVFVNGDQKTETKKEAQGLQVFQNLPALFRSFFGDPELWVRTHQVILIIWFRLNQVFDFKQNPERTEIQKMAFLKTNLSAECEIMEYQNLSQESEEKNHLEKPVQRIEFKV